MSVVTEKLIVKASIRLHIAPKVLSIWKLSIQDEEHKDEAFGVLIGGQNQNANQFWLETCTTPQRGDKSSTTSFTLKDPAHQGVVEDYFKKSTGTAGYLGTWHTHPEPKPTPSAEDLNDWKRCCQRNPDRTLIFIILGQTHFCIYRDAAKGFECVHEEQL